MLEMPVSVKLKCDVMCGVCVRCACHPHTRENSRRGALSAPQNGERKQPPPGFAVLSLAGLRVCVEPLTTVPRTCAKCRGTRGVVLQPARDESCFGRSSIRVWPARKLDASDRQHKPGHLVRRRAFFLGGGFGGVLSYFSGENANKTNFLHDRTVPIAVRPINAASAPPNTWLTSMMISPAAFPNSGPLDFPAPTFPNVSLEVLGLRTLATLTFEAEPRDPTSLLLPPYFTDFLTCNSKLAAGLPAGWELDATSTWTPSWFYFQARDFNATLTLQCAAEVVPTRLSVAMQQLLAPVQDAPTRRTKTLPLYPAAATTPPKSSSICAVLLDFETVEWGTWAPPHAPAVVAPEVNGGTLGLAALDAGRGVQYLGTSTDSPSFGIARTSTSS